MKVNIMQIYREKIRKQVTNKIRKYTVLIQLWWKIRC